MNRRTFSKMLAGAFGSTVVGLTPNRIEDRGIDMSEFCLGYEHPRFDVQEPFFQKGHDIATDGHVLIRVPSKGWNLECSGRRVPDFERVNWSAFDVAGWKPWPKKRIARSGSSRCRPCRGYGIVNRVDCDQCNGTVNEDSCSKCKGEMQVGDVCPSCKGKNCCFEHSAIIGAEKIDTRYEAMISDLPGVEFLTDSESVGVKESGHRRHGEVPAFAIPFRFDGGVGLVMPLARVSP